MPKAAKPAGTMLCPVPVVLVTCGSAGQRPNIITLAWAGTVCSNPPMIGLGIRPSRHSYAMIKRAGEFVVNLPTQAMLRAVDYCGVVSGAEVDKFEALGLTPGAAKHVQAPLIAECPINLEVRLQQVIPLGSHDLFLGEILQVHVDQEIMDSRGRIDPLKAGLVTYGPGVYWATGETLGTFGFSSGVPHGD